MIIDMYWTVVSASTKMNQTLYFIPIAKIFWTIQMNPLILIINQSFDYLSNMGLK